VQGTIVPEGERRLAAIMYTDIVGYTALSQKSESLAMKLLEMHRSMVRPFFSKHSGREVKTMGDAFLVEFASALGAVRCALDIQQSMHEMNQGRPTEKQIQLRIGVHVGDVVHREDDVYGDAVNVASRIEPLAAPGGVCVSEQVYDQVRNKFEFPLVSMGEKELKNVSEPVEVYRIALPWEEGVPVGLALDRRRVAVLPLASLSPEPADEYFADGMTDEVISRISRIDGLEVISRTSVMLYKKTPKSIREISKDLEVGTILEGSVRKAGNQLRVTIQMIDAARDKHLWAESYDRELQDVFAIQGDIAARVAESLSAVVPATASLKDTNDIEAYTTYLRAVQLLHENTQSSLKEAIPLFERAVSRDKSFARAHAALSSAWFYLAVYMDWLVAAKNSETAARRALELAPRSAEAHASMALVHMMLDRLKESVSEAEKAIELNPNLSEALLSLGMTRLSMGEIDKGLEALRRSHELDPLAFYVGFWFGYSCMIAGRDREALDVLGTLRELFPNNPSVCSALGLYYARAGDYTEAQKELDKSFQISSKDTWSLSCQGMLYALNGKREEAQGILKTLAGNENDTWSLNGRLRIQAVLGNKDEAFRVLTILASIHSWDVTITFDPLLAELREDARYTEFCEKVGVPL